MVSGKLGWQLTDIYLDVRSGTDAASRSEFQRMLRDCRANKLDIVFTKSISRFGRNTVETLSAINELRNCNVEVIFDQEELRTNDPGSQLLISILEGVAQEESEARSKSIRWGIIRKAEDGTSSLYKRKCYGYCAGENGELQINESEASVVRSVFDMYLQGKSIIGIKRELESRGIKSPTGNDAWCKRSIDVMLSNEKYSGDVIVFKTFNSGYPNSK
jgi:DNA invertase Pin-like site-specific DNA recombinase